MTIVVMWLYPESKFPVPHAWINPLGSNAVFGAPESGPTALTLCAASGDGLSTAALASARRACFRTLEGACCGAVLKSSEAKCQRPCSMQETGRSVSLLPGSRSVRFVMRFCFALESLPIPPSLARHVRYDSLR